jgi:DNA-binding CsgD family transcriptional regulator
MPRISQAQDRARRQITDLAARGLPAPDLATRIATVLETAIGWDGFRLFGLDQRTMLVNSLLAASENDAAARLEWLREVYLALPTRYAELPELARAGMHSVAFQEDQASCWGFSARDLAVVSPADHYHHYHETRSPVGGTILSIFRHQNRPVAAMQAYRRDPRRPYRRSEVQFVQMMGNIIGPALVAAIDRDAALVMSPPSPTAASGILLLNEHGGIQFATPAAAPLLDALGPREGTLPAAIWSALAAHRQQETAQAVTLSVQTGRGPVRVEVSASGDGAGRAVVLAPDRPPLGPQVPASWGLTPRESDIVEHLTLGKTNAAIADALFVSQHTVEWHLRAVFEKLGVQNRQEVMAALFRHTLLPDIERVTLAGAA